MRLVTQLGELVKKSNALPRGKWQPKSIWESRIIALVASKVHDEDKDFCEYRIPVSELTGVMDENLSGAQYAEIARGIRNLGTAVMHVQGENPRNFLQYFIFATVGYEDGEIIAKLHPDLRTHFLMLKEQFTVYSLFEFLMLPSTYSQSLFEFLKSWANCPEITITIAELHTMLDTPDSLRANFKDFRRRVLEQAHKDINTKTSLHFSWESIWQGRGVGSVRFVFQPSPLADNKDELFSKQQELVEEVVNHAMLALECAKEKKGLCIAREGDAEVCSTCQTLDFCGEIIREKSTKRKSKKIPQKKHR